jgi:ABC-type phosphate transport system substrate-binding protein
MVGALLFALAWLLPPPLITPPPLHAQQQPRKIVIAGAQSLTPLAEQFSNQFRKEHPKLEIEIRGGGSKICLCGRSATR